MKRIDLHSEFGQRNLGNRSRILKITDEIDIKDEKHVVLDLSKCFIDYPYGAMIIDKVLNQLSKSSGTGKRFEIIYDFIANDTTILNSLFNGSEYLKLTNHTSFTVQQIEASFSRLSLDGISVDLVIVDRQKNEIKRRKLC